MFLIPFSQSMCIFCAVRQEDVRLQDEDLDQGPDHLAGGNTAGRAPVHPDRPDRYNKRS